MHVTRAEDCCHSAAFRIAVNPFSIAANFRCGQENPCVRADLALNSVPMSVLKSSGCSYGWIRFFSRMKYNFRSCDVAVEKSFSTPVRTRSPQFTVVLSTHVVMQRQKPLGRSLCAKQANRKTTDFALRPRSNSLMNSTRCATQTCGGPSTTFANGEPLHGSSVRAGIACLRSSVLP